MKTLILVALIGLLFPGELQAVDWCYHCDNSPDCNDPYTPSSAHIGNCSSLENRYCVKEKHGEIATRGCRSNCVEINGRHDGEDYILTCCQTDNCNTGTMTSFSITLIMTSLLMVFYKLLL